MKALLKLLQVVLTNFKNVMIGLLILFLIGLGWTVYHDYQTQKQLHSDLIGQQDKYQQLNSNYAKLESDYVTSDQLHKKAEAEWGKEKADLDSQIKALASATFSTGKTNLSQVKADVVTDTFLLQEVQYLTVDGKLGPPVGYVQILTKDGSVTSGLYASDIQISAVVSQDPKTGRYRVLTKGSYILRDKTTVSSVYHTKPNWVGVPYPLTITGGEIEIDPRQNPPDAAVNKFRWAPHLNIGGYIGMSTVGFESGVPRRRFFLGLREDCKRFRLQDFATWSQWVSWLFGR
jgi:hypothetical protein